MSTDVAWLEVYNHQTQRYFYVNQETGEWSKEPPNDQIIKVDPDSIWSVWSDDAQMTLYYNNRTNQWSSHSPPSSFPVLSLSAFAKKPSLQRYILPTPNHQQCQQRVQPRPSELSIHHHYYPCQQYPLNSSPTFTHTAEQQPLSSVDSRKITDVSPKVKKQGSLLQMSKAALESTFRPKIFPQSFKRQPTKPSQTQREPPSTTEGISTTHMQCCPCASPKTLSPKISSPPFSPLSITPPPLSPTSLSSPLSATSPQTPDGHFNHYSFDQYVKIHFATYRRGLLKRSLIPLDEMSQWAKKSIHKPLLLSTDKNHAPDALDCFKKIQVIMGDRSRVYHGRNCTCDDVQDIQSIIMCGLTKGQHIRDEIYVQLCKQLNNNPSSTSTQKGWELLSALVLAIPPSDDLAPYLIQFVHNHHTTKSRQGDTDSLASFFELKLKEICEQGPREIMPTRAEIQLARISVNPKQQQERGDVTGDVTTLFGTTLTNLMDHQQTHNLTPLPIQLLKMPSIILWLVNAIRQLHGHSTQGIFRIPGLAEQITLLRTRLEHEYSTTGNFGNIDLESWCTDPNVPASLLRVWLRELPTSLIPEEYYDRCISADFDGATDIINGLTDLNRRVLLFIIGFLQEFIPPDICRHTLMTVDNLAMVFAPNLLRAPATNDLALVLKQSRYEQLFVKTLLLGPKVDMDQQLYG